MPQPLLLLITDVVIMSHESAAQRRCEPWRPVVVESAFTEGAFDSGCVFLRRQEKRGHGWHRSDRFPCLLRWKRNVVPVCAGEGRNVLQSPLLLPPRGGMKISAKFCETGEFFQIFISWIFFLWSVADFKSGPENLPSQPLRAGKRGLPKKARHNPAYLGVASFLKRGFGSAQIWTSRVQHLRVPPSPRVRVLPRGR